MCFGVRELTTLVLSGSVGVSDFTAVYIWRGLVSWLPGPGRLAGSIGACFVDGSIIAGYS